jgi:hypothetical protein
MGHPVYVAFHRGTFPEAVSPLVYCDYGGDSLIEDVLAVCQTPGVPGVAERSLGLALRWVEKYGFNHVAVFNLDAPGITPQMKREEIYRVCLDYLGEQVRSDDKYYRVDLDEFVVVGKYGWWQLGAEDA